MIKPFHIQGCCCCLRPSLDLEDEEKKIGKIDDPWKCLVMDQQIKDAQGKPVFTTTGSIWQLGMCCPCCASVRFDVMRGTTREAGIERMALSCAEMCLKTNRFKIDFDKVTDPA